ncbi:MAG: FAD-binding oxidoreductase [Flavobacteriales bacterium]|nr:FAD-binding oxidoreductase [Flavobacteriales bacterium]
MRKTDIAGWGNSPKISAKVEFPTSESELETKQKSYRSLIPRGAGKSYGDASLSPQMLSSEKLNRTIFFDIETGIFTCQSGKMLNDILDEIVPKGYFLPVTPGTKFITIGGAIAADIHGKNHHVDGCFSNHVLWFELMLANGDVRKCSRTENADLFWATCGGMGLTGFILKAAFKLKKIKTSKIVNRTIKCENLHEAIANLIEHENYTYSVAWIDCAISGKDLGRSLLYLGEHATEKEAPNERLARFKTPKPVFGLPFNLPSWTLNKWTVKAFNALFYGKVRKTDSTAIIDFESYFYPLDVLNNWNRLYGSNGFVQYQFVIPMEGAREGMERIVKEIVKSGESSFLAVLKLFGEENEGWLSFPKRGLQLALDFRANERSLELMDRLDDIVLEMNGRSYLAKDSRMKADFFAAGYPNLERFKRLLSEIDPNGKFRSLQSERLNIT